MTGDAGGATDGDGDVRDDGPRVGDRSWRALLRHRELTVALARRELTVRYKRSILGVGWALLEPVVVVLVYVAVFGHILGADRDLDNYLLFSLLGLVPWIFVSTTLEQCAGTLLEHAPLVKKIYFPRELLLVAVVFSRLTTLLICLLLTLVLVAWQGALGAPIRPAALPLLPVGMLLLTAMVFGLSLAVATLNVIVRDAAFLVRFALRIAFYACPIVYPITLVPAAARPWYELNPLVGILYCFQAVADVSVQPPSAVGVAASVVGPLACLVGGAWLFRRLESTVADLL